MIDILAVIYFYLGLIFCGLAIYLFITEKEADNPIQVFSHTPTEFKEQAEEKIKSNKRFYKKMQTIKSGKLTIIRFKKI